MKTLLQITQEDDNSLRCEMEKGYENVARIGLVFDKLSSNNSMFRALICATFVTICRATPEVLDQLHDNLNKEEQPSQAAIHVAPNPTKS